MVEFIAATVRVDMMYAGGSDASSFTFFLPPIPRSHNSHPFPGPFLAQSAILLSQ